MGDPVPVWLNSVRRVEHFGDEKLSAASKIDPQEKAKKVERRKRVFATKYAGKRRRQKELAESKRRRKAQLEYRQRRIDEAKAEMVRGWNNST